MSSQKDIYEKRTICLSISVSYSLFASTGEGNNIDVQQINASSCPLAFPPPLQNRSRVQLSAWLLSCYHSYRLDLFCLFTKALATSFVILMPTKRGHSGLELQGHGLWQTETSLASENGQSTLSTSRWLPRTILTAHSPLPTPLSTQAQQLGSLLTPTCTSTWSKGSSGISSIPLSHGMTWVHSKRAEGKVMTA